MDHFNRLSLCMYTVEKTFDELTSPTCYSIIRWHFMINLANRNFDTDKWFWMVSTRFGNPLPTYPVVCGKAFWQTAHLSLSMPVFVVVFFALFFLCSPGCFLYLGEQSAPMQNAEKCIRTEQACVVTSTSRVHVMAFMNDCGRHYSLRKLTLH